MPCASEMPTLKWTLGGGGGGSGFLKNFRKSATIVVNVIEAKISKKNVR